MKRVFRWQAPPRPAPRRPYRDSLLLYGSMAILLVVVATATGGSLVRALVVGGFFFVAATAWSWKRWRDRVREEERRRP